MFINRDQEIGALEQMYRTRNAEFEVPTVIQLDTGASHTCVAPYVINGLGYTVIGGEGKTITASGTVNKQFITLIKLVAIGNQ